MASPESKPVSKPPKASSSGRTQYLIIYNFVSALLWLVVLGRVVTLIPLVGFGGVYAGAGQFTKWTQSLAGLEIVHAATGIVHASVSTTIMQVASRILLIWAIVNPFPALGTSVGYSTMLIAWSVTEVIRYSYFTFNLSGYSPKFMTWLRYNTFFVLYPLGISSECWLVYRAIEPASKVRPELAWVLWGILGLYVPGAYILYTHMMKQRSKVLRGKQVKKTA